MATVHSRYTVQDSDCGFVADRQARMDAALAAIQHSEATGHSNVTVFDRMARPHTPQEWTLDGAIIAYRAEATSPSD